MPRTALALAAIATLTLNGSMASATMPAPAACGEPNSVCEISLRLMSPPPPRPADLMIRHTAHASIVQIAAAS